MPFTSRLALALALPLTPLLASTVALCQTSGGTLPAGTPLALTIDDHLPMRDGQPVRAHLIYPVYAGEKLLLPKDAVITGTVVALNSDHHRRVDAALGGDFTPFHKPAVRFTRILLPDGSALPFSADEAVDGAPIYRAVTPPRSQGGFFHKEIATGLSAARSDIAIFSAPGKADRLLQFVYGELPYHPQRIEKGTAWTIETTAPVDVPAQPAAPPPPPAAPSRPPHFWEERAPVPEPAHTDSGNWIVQAYLTEALSSETSTTGQTIKAVVAEPIYSSDHTVAIPQGATLVGAVTNAKPSRRFGRTGVLSFSFRQLILPDSEPQNVETRLTGADSPANIALNSEGQAKSKPQDKLAVPLILALMASRPLDSGEHGGGGQNQLAKNGTGGAAGLGLVGTIVGLAGGSPYAAAGIGYYGAARATYSRWIARGQKITFAKDTRIVVETTPRRSAPMKPEPSDTP